MRRCVIVLALLVGSPACGAASGQPAPADTGTAAHPRPPASVPVLAVTSEPDRERAEPVPKVEPWTPRPGDLEAPTQAFDDPTGHALDGFYAKLERVEAGEPGAMARVTHLGDSTIGLDGLTHAVRRRLQARFGDGGPGYLLLQRYSNDYKPRTVVHQTDERWIDCYIAYKCRPDGHYGLGGVTFSSAGGASTTLSLKHEPEHRREISNVELWYAGIPGGGRIELKIGRNDVHQIDTRAEVLEDRWHEVQLEPGPHRVQVRAAGRGPVRAYGIVMETDGPGVVYDGMSMIGAFTKRLNAWDAEHIADQLIHRDPDLLVMTYGGNDLRRVVAQGLTAEEYQAEYDEVLTKVRAGTPDLPCIVTSVIDHGRSGSYSVESKHVEVIVGAQKKVAAAHGCAFFNTYEAMGGPGSIYAWLRHQPRLAEPDLKHLNARGRDVMGQDIYRALMTGYVAYRARRSDPARAVAR